MTYSVQNTSAVAGYYPNWVTVSLSAGDKLGWGIEGGRNYRMMSAGNQIRGFSEYTTSVTLTSNFTFTCIMSTGFFDGAATGVVGFQWGWGIYLRDLNGRTVSIGTSSISTTNGYLAVERSGETAYWANWAYGSSNKYLRGFRIRDDGVTRYFDVGFGDLESSSLAFRNFTTTARTSHTTGPFNPGWTGNMYTNGYMGDIQLSRFSITGFVPD